MSHPIYEKAVFHQKFPTDANSLERREYVVNDNGYTTRELRFVFEVYRDPNNFNGPFMTTIAPTQLSVLTIAVRYFTNTDLKVLGCDHTTGRLIVECVGQP